VARVGQHSLKQGGQLKRQAGLDMVRGPGDHFEW
jgi:hypothetical protein